LISSSAVTHAAGLGRKCFVDFIEPHACVSALVPEGSKRTPARIEHRFGVRGLGKSGGTHVADEDGTVPSDEAGAELMQEITLAIRNSGVDGFDTRSLALPLPGAKAGVSCGGSG